MADEDVNFIIESVLEPILNGYSEYSISLAASGTTKLYIKHPSNFDSIKLYSIYIEFFEKFKKDGALSQSEQLSIMYENGWWSKEKEHEISYLNDSIKRLQQTRKKLIYDSDKKRIDEQINDLKNKLAILGKQKSEYVSSTAEDLASNECFNLFLENNIFIDKNFVEKIDVSDDEVFDLCIPIYVKYLNQFSQTNIKKAAISTVFQNMIHTSSGTSMDVFGLPVIKLTKFQSELLIWSNYYQKLIKSCTKEIPDELYNDPDKFIEWYESVNNVEINKKSNKKRKDKKSKYGSESKYLFGDRDEIKKIGGEISGDKILKDAEKSSDGLGIYDLMEK